MKGRGGVGCNTVVLLTGCREGGGCHEVRGGGGRVQYRGLADGLSGRGWLPLRIPLSLRWWVSLLLLGVGRLPLLLGVGRLPLLLGVGRLPLLLGLVLGVVLCRRRWQILGVLPFGLVPAENDFICKVKCNFIYKVPPAFVSLYQLHENPY
jgi:hypothetical protein